MVLPAGCFSAGCPAGGTGVLPMQTSARKAAVLGMIVTWKSPEAFPSAMGDTGPVVQVGARKRQHNASSTSDCYMF